mmetsp:Transcript_27140/g.73657  ORF Transcript_27140/g.73657 Transcript_27140/m.73657 type:complete len:230 (+) Transcript_27140:152-841(+)
MRWAFMAVHSASSFCARRMAQSESLLPFLSFLMIASTCSSVIRPLEADVSRGPKRLSRSASVKPLFTVETLPLTLSTSITCHEMPPSRAFRFSFSRSAAALPFCRISSSWLSSFEASLSSPDSDESLRLRLFLAFFRFLSSWMARFSACGCGGLAAAQLLLALLPPSSSSLGSAASWKRRLLAGCSSGCCVSAVEDATRSTVLGKSFTSILAGIGAFAGSKNGSEAGMG